MLHTSTPVYVAVTSIKRCPADDMTRIFIYTLSESSCSKRYIYHTYDQSIYCCAALVLNADRSALIPLPPICVAYYCCCNPALLSFDHRLVKSGRCCNLRVPEAGQFTLLQPPLLLVLQHNNYFTTAERTSIPFRLCCVLYLFCI